jgi:hypothetical protein
VLHELHQVTEERPTLSGQAVAARRRKHRPDSRDYLANVAAAKASLAVYDAVIALRDQIEALPAQLEGRLRAGQRCPPRALLVPGFVPGTAKRP